MDYQVITRQDDQVNAVDRWPGPLPCRLHSNRHGDGRSSSARAVRTRDEIASIHFGRLFRGMSCGVLWWSGCDTNDPLLLQIHSLNIVLFRAATIRDCPEAEQELQKDIKEAREDLVRKGFTFRE